MLDSLLCLLRLELEAIVRNRVLSCLIHPLFPLRCYCSFNFLDIFVLDLVFCLFNKAAWLLVLLFLANIYVHCNMIKIKFRVNY